MKSTIKVVLCLALSLLLVSPDLCAQAMRNIAAITAFREARDRIDDRDWQKAENGFNRFVADYPQDREVPAALYWLAFSLKQQSKFPAADAALNKLIQGHPASTWLNDAKAMRVEIAPRLKNTQLIEQGVRDDDDEIRLTALQSLFESRPERAIPMAAEILKQGSNASRTLKEGVVSLLEDSETKDAIPLLVQIARNDSDIRVRRKAVHALAEIEDTATARKTLMEIARSNADLDVRADAIRAMGEIEDEPAVVQDLVAMMASLKETQLQRAVIQALGEIETESAAEGLVRLYDVEKDERTKELIIEALEETETRAALRKVKQIAAQETSTRLRKRALEAIEDLEDSLK